MEPQLTVEDFTCIQQELTQEYETGIWTAVNEDNRSKYNAINRVRRLKSLNYFLFKSLSDKPYDLWPTSGARCFKQDKNEDDAKKCICGHKIWDYTVVESDKNHRAYIGMCCIKKFDKDWNKIIRANMKKCACGEKKKMTDTHCKNCRVCLKCRIIKPHKNEYYSKCYDCYEDSLREEHEKRRNEYFERTRKLEEEERQKETKRVEYITSKINELKQALNFVRNDKEIDFVTNLIKNFVEYKNPTISEKQQNWINNIILRAQ